MGAWVPWVPRCPNRAPWVPRFLLILLGPRARKGPFPGSGIPVLRRRIWAPPGPGKWFVARVLRKDLLGFRVPGWFPDRILTILL